MDVFSGTRLTHPDIVIRYLIGSCVGADSFTEFVVRVALHQENLTHAPVHDSSD